MPYLYNDLRSCIIHFQNLLEENTYLLVLKVTKYKKNANDFGINKDICNS